MGDLVGRIANLRTMGIIQKDEPDALSAHPKGDWEIIQTAVDSDDLVKPHQASLPICL